MRVFDFELQLCYIAWERRMRMKKKNRINEEGKIEGRLELKDIDPAHAKKLKEQLKQLELEQEQEATMKNPFIQVLKIFDQALHDTTRQTQKLTINEFADVLIDNIKQQKPTPKDCWIDFFSILEEDASNDKDTPDTQKHFLRILIGIIFKIHFNKGKQRLKKLISYLLSVRVKKSEEGEEGATVNSEVGDLFVTLDNSCSSILEDVINKRMKNIDYRVTNTFIEEEEERICEEAYEKIYRKIKEINARFEGVVLLRGMHYIFQESQKTIDKETQIYIDNIPEDMRGKV